MWTGDAEKVTSGDRVAKKHQKAKYRKRREGKEKKGSEDEIEL